METPANFRKVGWVYPKQAEYVLLLISRSNYRVKTDVLPVIYLTLYCLIVSFPSHLFWNKIYKIRKIHVALLFSLMHPLPGLDAIIADTPSHQYQYSSCPAVGFFNHFILGRIFCTMFLSYEGYYRDQTKRIGDLQDNNLCRILQYSL